jgi:hypothetical protein
LSILFTGYKLISNKKLKIELLDWEENTTPDFKKRFFCDDNPPITDTLTLLNPSTELILNPN